MSGFARRLQQGAAGLIPGPSFGGFPDASTTGITGVGLTPADLTASSSVTISANDTVLDMLDIAGTVRFATGTNATGCIIKRCRIQTAGATYAISVVNAGGPVIIEDCEIIYTLPTSSLSGSTAAISLSGSYAHQILRCDISVFPHGIDCSGQPYLIQDNYIHDLAHYVDSNGQGTHNDCIYMASSNGGQILHNSLLNPLPQTAAIINDVHAAGSGNFNGLTIDNNLMAGGGYTIYPVNDSTNPNNISFTNVHITNNVFSRLIGTAPGTQPYPAYYANGGNFGAKYPTGFSTYFADPSNVWSGNTWGDDGSTIP